MTEEKWTQPLTIEQHIDRLMAMVPGLSRIDATAVIELAASNPRQFRINKELIEKMRGAPDPGPVKSIQYRNTRNDIGRNDPCPCGSGYKFKKCCIKQKGREGLVVHHG